MKEWKLALVVGAMTLLGVAVGAQMFGAQPATAQTTGYRQCFIGRQETVDIDGEGVVALPERSRSIIVPSGYEVVSGGGGDATRSGYVLFCRR
jgi:hypothetical protein